MKRIISLLIVIVLILFVQPRPIFAKMGMMGNYFNVSGNSESSSSTQIENQFQQNLQNLVNNLLHAQNISSTSQLNCQKVIDDQFENIGNAWMDYRINNQQIHQQMDNMMGGEGSESLRQAHIQMGESFLDCPLTGNTINWMPMMFGISNTAAGGGVFPMMGWGGYGFGSMAGWSGVFGVLAALVWLIVFVDLILAGIWLWQQVRSSKKK